MESKQGLKYLYFILAGAIVSLFCISVMQPFIENDIIEFFNERFLFDSTTSAVLYIISVLFLIIPYTLKLFTKKSIQKKAMVVSWILLLTYLSYRLIIPHPAWFFTSWHNILTYFDVLYLFPLMYSVYALCIYSERIPKKLKMLFVKEEEKDNVMPGNSDASITKPSDDRLDYDIHARKLLKMIIEGQEYYRAGAYSIGLLGKWGQGKTSFLNLMKYAVNHNSDPQYFNKVIIVEFNPWFSGTKDQILVDFMRKIKATLSPYNPDINHSIDQYVEVLFQMDLGWFSKLARLFHTHQSESIQERFKILNDSIAAIKKPVIVLLDDVDRLLSEEIFAVLQLIRNTANFKNTVFIVPYDKAYLTTTLKNGNVIRPDEYLEKIFTLSYNLPNVTDDRLKNINKEIIKKTLLIDNDSDEIQYVDLFLDDIEDSLSIRQTKSLAQNVTFTGALLLKDNEIVFFLYDLLLVEYLKMINIQFFYHLSQAPEELLSKSVSLQYLILNKRINKYGEEKKYSDEEFINERILPYSGGDKASAYKSYKILHLLFDTPDDISAHKYRHAYRLRSSYVFNYYFIRTLPDNLILKSDFEKARNGSKDEFKDFLVQRITQENRFTLGFMLEDVIFKNEDDGMEILNASCEIMRDRYMTESSDLKILVLPGGFIFGKLYYSNGIIYDRERAKLHWKILGNFCKDVTYNNNFEKRFSILCLYKDSGIIARQNELFKSSEGINFSELYLEYLIVYLDHKIDCQNFNDEFFWRLEKDVISEHKKKANSILKIFIANHLRSFITELYSPRLDSHGIYNLFAINENGQSTNKNDALENYITFLKNQTDEILKADWFLKHFKEATNQLMKIN